MAHMKNKKIRTLYAEKETAAKDEKKDKSQSQGQLMIAGIAAAVEKSMTTAFSTVQKEQAKVNEKVLSALESISASQTELVSGLHELALGKLDAAAAEEEEKEEVEDVQARGKKADATDATDASASDASANPSDATAAAAADPSMPMAADATDPTNYDSSSQGDDATPGDLNPDASSNAHSEARSGSTHLSPGKASKNPGIAAASDRRKGTLVQISAAAKMIRSLKAENDSLRHENKKQQNRISAIEASLERYADRVERRSVSPEISALLEKSGYDVRELISSKSRLSVADVDQMFAQSGIPLEPSMRAAFKNQLLQLGIMDSGEVRRFAN
jgi:hypothetical protein